MINLYIALYNEKNPDRAREFERCLRWNMDLPQISNVYVVSEDVLDYRSYPEINDGVNCQIYIKSRPTFADMFKIANGITAIESKPYEVISIIANADIYFDDTIELATHMDIIDCYALTRYDEGQMIVKSNSQDSWIFKGMISTSGADLDFHMGTLGCDNHLAYILQQSGYCVSNPSLSIKTHHMHASAIRNYSRTNVVPRPYRSVKITALK